MGLRDLISRLAPTQDSDPSPQARDERPFAISREEHTQDPDRDGIDRWTTEYEQNPLIRQPVRNFAGDVLEPGLAVEVALDDGDAEPTVPEDYRFQEFRGMELGDALERWLARAGIVGGQFGRPTSALLEDALIDLRGRRGTALIEHAWDDPTEREYLLALRLFAVETATAYTREGKQILMRPDDNPNEAETVALGTDTDSDFYDAPTTPAGKTAAFVQYDDILGRYSERDDIPFALDDVTMLTNDPDTGALFGTPDTASVAARSEELREMFGDTAQAVKALGYGHWLAQVDTNDEAEAKKLLSGLDPDSPERVNVINYAAEVEQFDAEEPASVDVLQQHIEYILAGLPTPLYRVGFAGDINRDVTDVQQDDYRDEIRRERDRLAGAVERILRLKAKEFLLGDATSDERLNIDLELAIEPEAADSPLEDEEFDADEFAATMKGIKAAAPGGAAAQVVPVHELRETFLGLDAEPPKPPAETDTGLPLPDESDERVQAAFRDAYLGTQYSEGDVVQSPQGLGVVVEVRTGDFEAKGETRAASESSPTYVVALRDGRVRSGFYSASQLDAAEMPETGVEDPTAALAAPAPTPGADGADGVALSINDWSNPESWQEADAPARLIALDAWASMGGDFEGARDHLGSDELAASFKDYILGYETWR